MDVLFRSVLGCFSFSISLLDCYWDWTSWDWKSSLSIVTVNVITNPLSEPIRHPLPCIRTQKWQDGSTSLFFSHRSWLFVMLSTFWSFVALFLSLSDVMSFWCRFVHLYCKLTLILCSRLYFFDLFLTRSAETRLVCQVTYTKQHIEFIGPYEIRFTFPQIPFCSVLIFLD